MRGRIQKFAGIILRNEFAGALLITALGLLVALGPQFLFKVCATGEDGFPRCHWSAQAEIGVGALIAALGLALALFRESGPRLGLLIAVFFSAVIVLCIPHALIGGCGMMSMACRRTAFPAITLTGIVLLVYSVFAALFIEWSKGKTESETDKRH